MIKNSTSTNAWIKFIINVVFFIFYCKILVLFPYLGKSSVCFVSKCSKWIPLDGQACPALVTALEGAWGAWLVAQRQAGAGVAHLIEAGRTVDALRAAVRAHHYKKALQILEVLHVHRLRRTHSTERILNPQVEHTTLYKTLSHCTIIHIYYNLHSFKVLEFNGIRPKSPMI